MGVIVDIKGLLGSFFSHRFLLLSPLQLTVAVYLQRRSNLCVAVTVAVRCSFSKRLPGVGFPTLQLKQQSFGLFNCNDVWETPAAAVCATLFSHRCSYRCSLGNCNAGKIYNSISDTKRARPKSGRCCAQGEMPYPVTTPIGASRRCPPPADCRTVAARVLMAQRMCWLG